MPAKSIEWSEYKEYQADREAKTAWSETERLTPVSAIRRSAFLYDFSTILNAFVKKANRFEVVRVQWWYYPYLYIDVEDTRYQHYPCNMRACVSFDLSNGKLASPESRNRNAHARKGWGAFVDRMVGYKVPRYHECGNKEKLEQC